MDTFREVIQILSVFVLPLIIVGFPLYGLYKKVPVYEEFVEGAKGGFDVAVTIIPYLIEEAHEAVEAIEAQDSDHLCEELGDLLRDRGIAVHELAASGAASWGSWRAQFGDILRMHSQEMDSMAYEVVSTLVRYLFRRMGMKEIEETAEDIIHSPVQIVVDPPAELAMDADKPDQVDMLRAELRSADA